MKPFAFNLEAVLTVRTREEQSATESWARAVREQTHAQQVLAEAMRELEDAHQALFQKRSARFHPGDQALYLNAIGNQKNACEQLAKVLSEAVAFAHAKHATLLKARMKREVLSRLKQKKMNEYLRIIQAKEEAAVDDLIIVRHGRGRADS